MAGRRLMRASFDPATGAVGAPGIVQNGAAERVLAVTPAGRVLLSPLKTVRGFVTLQWLRELRDRLPQPVVAPR
jgi:hypothetical protein